MLLKSNSFYLTGIFKVLCELCQIFYMYPFEVISMKNDAKIVHCILICNKAQENLHLFEIAQLFEENFCCNGSI